MRFIRLAFFVFLATLSGLDVFGQATLTPSTSSEDADKRVKLDALIEQGLDEAITSTTSLHLPENRAVAYAMLGDMYWRFDQKRARELFRNITMELSAYNTDMEKEAADQNVLGMDMTLATPDPRYQVIPLIAKHDAELAMQVMQQTRRPDVAQAIVSGVQYQQGMSIGPNGAAALRASQEIALEQQILLYAADQDPDAAIRAIKDSIAKRLSYNVLPLLLKLAKLDEKKTGDLASDVVQKLLDTDMVKNQDSLRVAINLLQYSANLQPPRDPQIKQFNFTDVQQKDMAGKLATTLLAIPLTTSSNNWFTQGIPLVDKYAPDRSAALKQRQAETQKNVPADIRSLQQRMDLLNPNISAEQIVALLPKLPDENKTAAYAALMNKIRTIPDDAQAKRLIDQVPDEKVRDSLEQQLESTRSERMIQAGKLDDARKQIAQMTDHRQQIQRYVSLALAYFKSGKDADTDAARSVLKDARALAAAFPETGNDLADLMELIKGYAVVEPDAAFKMAESGVDMINEHVQATAVLSRYNKDLTFRNGEMVFRPNGFSTTLIFRYLPQFQLLGKADLERANQLLDRFSRADARFILRLYILQGATPEPAPPPRPVAQ